MRPREIRPLCNLAYCEMNEEGSCIALSNTNFRGKTCPFYKAREKDPEQDPEEKERLPFVKGNMENIKKLW